MSIFSAIKDAIFGGPAAAAEVSAAPAPVSTGAAPSPSPTPSDSAAAPSATASAPNAASAVTPVSSAPAPAKVAMTKVDVAAVLDKRDEDSDEDLDWRVSIVDLMKLLKLDSSLKARKALAKELQYDGDMSDSAKMNVWLHQQVMAKLAENGGIVPADLRD